MANTASPYGLRAVNELGGLPYAGSTRTFLIDPAGYNTNIYNGSVVALNTSGYVNIVTTNGIAATPFPAGTIGVFVGCSYVNAQGQQIWSNYYPANVTGVVTCSVIDDDRAVFQVQSVGPVAQDALGANVYFNAVQSTSTGSTRTGNSTSALESTVVTTAAAFKIIGFASPLTDTYTEVFVKLNPGASAFTNAVGI